MNGQGKNNKKCSFAAINLNKLFTQLSGSSPQLFIKLKPAFGGRVFAGRLV